MNSPNPHIYFGGSFFPPHKAHTEMLTQALNRSSEGEIIVVPTKQNPLKKSPGAPLALIQAWIEDLGEILSYQKFTRIRLETYEITSGQEKNYTVDTLATLKKNSESKTPWILLLGSDSAETFSQWKNPTKILSLLQEIWIVPRLKDSEDKLENSHFREECEKIFQAKKLVFLDPVAPISSTELRDEASSQRLDEFLSPRVLTVWKQLLS